MSLIESLVVAGAVAIAVLERLAAADAETRLAEIEDERARLVAEINRLLRQNTRLLRENTRHLAEIDGALLAIADLQRQLKRLALLVPEDREKRAP